MHFRRSFLRNIMTAFASAQIIYGSPVAFEGFAVQTEVARIDYLYHASVPGFERFDTLVALVTKLNTFHTDITAVNDSGIITLTAKVAGRNANAFLMEFGAHVGTLELSNATQGSTGPAGGRRFFEGGVGEDLIPIPKFLGVDLAIPTYTWSAGANPSYPISNLKTYYPDVRSRNNTTTDGQYLLIDFGSPVSLNTLIIHGHNFDSFGLITRVIIQTNVNDDTSFSDPEVIDVPIIQDPLVSIFATKTKRYWRFLFSKGSELDAAPEIGNIFLGKSLDFETTQEPGFHTNIPKSKTYVIDAQDGRRKGIKLFRKRKHLISFKQSNLQSDNFKTDYLNFLRLVDNNSLPFYYIDNKLNIYLANLERDEHPYEEFKYNQNKLGDLHLKSTMGE